MCRAEQHPQFVLLCRGHDLLGCRANLGPIEFVATGEFDADIAGESAFRKVGNLRSLFGSFRHLLQDPATILIDIGFDTELAGSNTKRFHSQQSEQFLGRCRMVNEHERLVRNQSQALPAQPGQHGPQDSILREQDQHDDGHVAAHPQRSRATRGQQNTADKADQRAMFQTGAEARPAGEKRLGERGCQQNDSDHQVVNQIAVVGVADVYFRKGISKKHNQDSHPRHPSQNISQAKLRSIVPGNVSCPVNFPAQQPAEEGGQTDQAELKQQQEQDEEQNESKFEFIMRHHLTKKGGRGERGAGEDQGNSDRCSPRPQDQPESAVAKLGEDHAEHHGEPPFTWIGPIGDAPRAQKQQVDENPNPCDPSGPVPAPGFVRPKNVGGRNGEILVRGAGGNSPHRLGGYSINKPQDLSVWLELRAGASRCSAFRTAMKVPRRLPRIDGGDWYKLLIRPLQFAGRPMSHAVTDYSSALAFLYGRINYERTLTVPYGSGAFKLDRFRQFLELLGNPQEKLPAVHLTGTKGKGSTAAMVAAILTAAGRRTALYTSPHLERLEERFVIGGKPVDTDELVRWTQHLQPLVEDFDRRAEETGERSLTFFEVTTALAFLMFVACDVEIAVLEVGLGGRLDSTNVCRPLVCGITSISLDHMKQLGNTKAEIAREKAGIIKPSVPVVSGVIDPEAREVISQVADDVGVVLWQRGTDFDFDFTPAVFGSSDGTKLIPGKMAYREKMGENRFELPPASLAMLGEHQGANAATAVAIVRRLGEQGYAISNEAIQAGLANARAAARVEWISGSPPLVLDTAHNGASIRALLQALPQRPGVFNGSRNVGYGAPRVLVFAASRDKDTRSMLALLVPEFDVIFLTQYLNNPRAVPPEELLTEAEELVHAGNGASALQLKTVEDPHRAFRMACEWGEKPELVVVTGSFFLAGELSAAVRQYGAPVATVGS